MPPLHTGSKTKYATILTSEQDDILCKSGRFVGKRIIGPENSPGKGEETVLTPERTIKVSDEKIESSKAVFRALEIYKGEQ